MDPIASFSGLASGIQWRDMVDQLMKIETSRRLAPVTNRISSTRGAEDAWSEYQRLVQKLQDASEAFADGSAFGMFRTSARESASGRALVKRHSLRDGRGRDVRHRGPLARPGREARERAEIATPPPLSAWPAPSTSTAARWLSRPATR